MARATAAVERQMTVGEFLAWSEEQGDEARFELVDGLPVRLMAPTKLRHAQIQYNVAHALRLAIERAGLRCRVYDAGPGVAADVGGDECRIPDVAMTCATGIDDTTSLVPEPLIVVEIASPSTRLTDVNDKVEFYSRIASIRHYLVIEQDRRRMVVFGRAQGGGLEPRVVRAGSIALDPPGIELALEALYHDTPLDEMREREEG